MKKVVTISRKALKAAYLIFLRIAAQCRKSRTIGETLIMPEATDMCKTSLGAEQNQETN